MSPAVYLAEHSTPLRNSFSRLYPRQISRHSALSASIQEYTYAAGVRMVSDKLDCLSAVGSLAAGSGSYAPTPRLFAYSIGGLFVEPRQRIDASNLLLPVQILFGNAQQGAAATVQNKDLVARKLDVGIVEICPVVGQLADVITAPYPPDFRIRLDPINIVQPLADLDGLETAPRLAVVLGDGH